MFVGNGHREDRLVSSDVGFGWVGWEGGRGKGREGEEKGGRENRVRMEDDACVEQYQESRLSMCMMRQDTCDREQMEEKK